MYRAPLVSFTNLTISSISVGTVLRHFFPQKYLDFSERWNNKIFLFVTLTLSMVHLVWVGKSCGGPCKKVGFLNFGPGGNKPRYNCMHKEPISYVNSKTGLVKNI